MPRFLTLIVVGSLFVSGAAMAGSNLVALAQARWSVVASPNFEIITDLDEEQARLLSRDLEMVREFTVRTMVLEVVQDAKPLKILAISDRGNFRRLGLPEQWAGLFARSLSGYAAIANVRHYKLDTDAGRFARQVLLHEYHHFLASHTERPQALPAWVSEGMAEYWGSFSYEDGKVTLGGLRSGAHMRVTALYDHRGRIAVDTESLFTRKYGVNDESDVELHRFYGQAYFAIHYFNSTPALRAELAAYVAHVGAGYTWEAAARLAFKRTHAQLDEQIDDYLKNGFGVRVFSAREGALTFTPPQTRARVLDQAGFHAEAAGVLSHASGAIERKALDDFFATAVALNPTLVELKFLQLNHANPADWTRIARELEAAFPNHPLALVVKGDALWLRAAQAGAGAGADGERGALLRAARNLYRRAVAADPMLVQGYHRLGLIYADLPAGEPLQEGVLGLDSASIYLPTSGIFEAMVDLFIRMDKPMEALPSLRNAVALSGDPAASRYALLLENVELLSDLGAGGKAAEGGLAYPSGTSYRGPVRDGKPDGAGKLTRSNGNFYEGAFADGLMHGAGRLGFPGGPSYEGAFSRGMARGQARIGYRSGAVYLGPAAYSLPEGKGVQTMQNGRYEGDFVRGQAHGDGVFTAAHGQTVLSGAWVAGAHRWPLADGVHFSGAVSAAGRRDGKGVCRSAGIDAPAAPCHYKDGRRLPDPSARY
ncbi:MAG: hypothetical protein V4857_30835 [Pseudomonadota bacterium]